jgi:hypothetical protein
MSATFCSFILLYDFEKTEAFNLTRNNLEKDARNLLLSEKVIAEESFIG